MVQIRKRQSVQLRWWLRRILRCCASGIMLSSAIPSVFLFRTWLLHQQPKSEQHVAPIPLRPLALPPAIAFLQHVDWATTNNNVPVHGSDFVELHHCNVTSPTVWLQMWNQSETLLRQAVSALQGRFEESSVHDIPGSVEPASSLAERQQRVKEEFVLELLEQYAVFHQLCSFRHYRPTVPPSIGESLAPKLLAQQHNATTTNDDDDAFRIVFCISAFHDIDHLLRLVRALRSDNSIILIHLERSTSPAFRQSIEAEAPHVIVVQFGTIVYRTDSLSLVNLRILRWITLDLQLRYDYIVFMDGASFPLRGPSEWQTHLGQQRVWLGELTNNGNQVRLQNGLEHRLQHQRLISTPYKLHKRLGRNTWHQDALHNQKIQDNLLYKSTSGNQGAYHRDVVKLLLESDDVMELFALSKYGCCCCLEEYNWISALHMIGYATEALQHTSTFQLWGGQSTSCESSMNNAVLSLNRSLCYRTEDPAAESLHIYGSSLLQELRSARERGFLTARKFRSKDRDSDEIINFIERELWKQTS